MKSLRWMLLSHDSDKIMLHNHANIFPYKSTSPHPVPGKSTWLSLLLPVAGNSLDLVYFTCAIFLIFFTLFNITFTSSYSTHILKFILFDTLQFSLLNTNSISRTFFSLEELYVEFWPENGILYRGVVKTYEKWIVKSCIYNTYQDRM